jgi:hypothetical protein
MKRNKIVRVYTRKYRDTGQVTAYVDWSDGTRTEGPARHYNKVPMGTHMQTLFDRALRDGLNVEREEW